MYADFYLDIKVWTEMKIEFEVRRGERFFLLSNIYYKKARFCDIIPERNGNFSFRNCLRRTQQNIIYGLTNQMRETPSAQI